MIQERKQKHLDIVKENNVQHTKTNGLENIELEYDALPELNYGEIELNTKIFKKNLNFPLLVSGMTGGTTQAKKINQDIAKVCQKQGIGMGIGSQRAMIQHKQLEKTYQIRDVAPDIYLSANIGGVQLKQIPHEEIIESAEKIEADTITIHINPLQELIQNKGDLEWKGIMDEIKLFKNQTKKPVIIKEVGHGISEKTAKKISKLKIDGIDVQGVGGTSWAAVESYSGNKHLGKMFWSFGIQTSESIIQTRKHFDGTIIGSGGIRTGEEIVKTIAIGANVGAMATPIFKAQQKNGQKGIETLFEQIKEEIKATMYLIGAKNINEIKQQKTIIKTIK